MVICPLNARGAPSHFPMENKHAAEVVNQIQGIKKWFSPGWFIDDHCCGSVEKKELLPNPHLPIFQVRNFLESSLTELRELWMQRISYQTCVQCYCDLTCGLHNVSRCSQPECLHFLNLDECIASKVRLHH